MDLLIPFRLAGKNGLSRINVVNKVNSTLARENECGIFLNCGREFSVASTKAFVCQVTVMTLIAIWFAQNKNFNATKKMRASIINELKMLSANMKKTLESINEKNILLERGAQTLELKDTELNKLKTQISKSKEKNIYH